MLFSQCILFLFLSFCCFYLLKIQADEGVYSDTIGAANGNIYLNLNFIKNIHLFILIDGDNYAGTTDTITATFVGNFASSGPMVLGSFPSPGQSYTLNLELQREIGDLQGIWIENSGYDSVLFSQIQCRIQSINYQVDIPRTWLQTWDPYIVNNSNQDGYSPNADLSLPSSSTLYLPVINQYYDYTSAGVNTSPN